MEFTSKSRTRIIFLGCCFFIFYALIVFRLANIQLSSKNRFEEKISNQSIRKVRVPSVRGEIISSDNVVVAENIPSYNIVFHLAEMRQRGVRRRTVDFVYKSAKRLAELLDRDLRITKKDIIRQMNMRPAMPMTILKKLSKKELAKVSEVTPPIPGMAIKTVPKRHYPYKKIGCHLIGYTREGDPDSDENKSEYSYYIPDIEGKNGVEAMVDEKVNLGAGYNGLSGTAGSKLLKVNVKGYVHEQVGGKARINGNNVMLTVNWKAQKAASKVLKDKVGALVLLNADTGAVKAMASTPGYDPNEFVNGISQKKWNNLIKNKERPLVNEALMGEYMPGSIVKPLVALAALKAGLNPNATIHCDGAAEIGNAEIKCWAWQYGGHGDENLISAIRDSCNVYFVKTGIDIGLERIRKMYKAVGFGEKTGIGLSERTGLCPSRKLKRRLGRGSWNAFDTGLISIGQGLINITPIQAAVYTSGIANGGTIYKPYLIEKVFNYNHKLLYKQHSHKKRELPVKDSQLDLVREGMYKVVNTEMGSGNNAKNDIIDLYGKTGTAQIGSEGKKNTWFIGFGDYEGKTYAIAVFVKGGESGGSTNAPMAKEFFETWLGERE